MYEVVSVTSDSFKRDLDLSINLFIFSLIFDDQCLPLIGDLGVSFGAMRLQTVELSPTVSS